MNSRWLVVAAVALLVAGPLVYRIAQGNTAKPVEVAVVASRPIAPSILASGVLTYKSQVTLVAEVVARVDRVLFKVGDRVRKGEPLIRLDCSTAEAQVLQLQASSRQTTLGINRAKLQRESAQRDVERYDELRRYGMVEAAKLDDMKSRRDTAEVDLHMSEQAARQVDAQLAQSNDAVSKCTIRSPMDGQVVQISIKAGETAVPSAMSIAGGSLMMIADTRDTFAEVNVDESDVSQLAVGQHAQVSPASSSGGVLTGTVEEIALTPKVEPNAGRTYPVRIRVTGGETKHFYPGMSARAEISAAQDATPRLALPLQAVQYHDTEANGAHARPTAFVVNGDVATVRELALGVADDGYVEILSGLAAGDRVIVGPAKTLRFLRHGERVAPSAAASSARPAPERRS